jgi:hypothetical protein
VRAEFYRPEDPDLVLATARYGEGSFELEGSDGELRDALARIFHPAPVAVDDPSLRQAGTTGPTVFPPGSLAWFQTAARARSAPEGLGVRLVPEEERAMGWDPAGAYRSFSDTLVRRVSIGGPERAAEREAGERRPKGERGPSAPGTEAARPERPPSAAGPSPQTKGGSEAGSGASEASPPP